MLEVSEKKSSELIQMMPIAKRQALLSKYTSRQNKLWLVTAWKYFCPWYVEWKWAGDPFRSRMLFQFSPDGKWVEAQSFEEDLMSTYKFGKETKQ